MIPVAFARPLRLHRRVPAFSPAPDAFENIWAHHMVNGTASRRIIKLG